MMPNAPHDPAKRLPPQQAGRQAHPATPTVWPEAIAPPPVQRLVPASIKHLPKAPRALRRRKFAEAWDWAVLISIVLHVLIISLQFGVPGSAGAHPADVPDDLNTTFKPVPPPPPEEPVIVPPTTAVLMPPGEFVISLAPPAPAVQPALVEATVPPPKRSHAARKVLTAERGKWRVEKGEAAKAAPAALADAPVGAANVESPADAVTDEMPSSPAAPTPTAIAKAEAPASPQAVPAPAVDEVPKLAVPSAADVAAEKARVEAAEQAHKAAEAQAAADEAARKAEEAAAAKRQAELAQAAAQKAQAIAQAEQARKAEEAAALQRAKAEEEAAKLKAATEAAAAERQRQLELARAEETRKADEARKAEAAAAEQRRVEQQAKAEQERRAAELAAQEKAAREKAEQERVARERAEQEKAAQERAAQEKVAQEKAAQAAQAAKSTASQSATPGIGRGPGGKSDQAGTQAGTPGLLNLHVPLSPPPQLSLAENALRQLHDTPREEKPSPRRRGVLNAKLIASDAAYGFYRDSWRGKIQRVLALSPLHYAHDRYYNPLVMTIVVNSDGTLASAVVVESSGDRRIDDAAKRIVEMSAPFSRFPDRVREQFDQLEITHTWQLGEDGAQLNN